MAGSCAGGGSDGLKEESAATVEMHDQGSWDLPGPVPKGLHRHWTHQAEGQRCRRRGVPSRRLSHAGWSTVQLPVRPYRVFPDELKTRVSPWPRAIPSSSLTTTSID